MNSKFFGLIDSKTYIFLINLVINIGIRHATHLISNLLITYIFYFLYILVTIIIKTYLEKNNQAQTNSVKYLSTSLRIAQQTKSDKVINMDKFNEEFKTFWSTYEKDASLLGLKRIKKSLTKIKIMYPPTHSFLYGINKNLQSFLNRFQ